jgi:hypothetical protein
VRSGDHDEATRASVSLLATTARTQQAPVRATTPTTPHLSSSTTMASSPADTSTETVETSEVGFSSLPLDVIATHVLRPDFLPDPADLRRLREVSKHTRDAVDATGRPVYELTPEEAVRRGDLNGLQLLLERAPRVRT